MTFNDFFSPLIPLFKSATQSYGLDHADSQDVIQETMISLWNKFSTGKLDMSKNTTGYALQLIHWRAKDAYRTKKRSGEIFLSLEDSNLDALPCPPEPPVRRFPTRILSYAKKRLKPRDFEIFTDHFIRGKSASFTAERFKLDKSMVYMVRCRSLKKVKEYNV